MKINSVMYLDVAWGIEIEVNFVDRSAYVAARDRAPEKTMCIWIAHVLTKTLRYGTRARFYQVISSVRLS